VDNFVDKSPPGRSTQVISASAAPIAQKNGMAFLFEINDIAQNVAAFAATSVRNANAGAAVELSTRVGRPSVDG
jgi:predicted hotdog family 3-hydroxylacyl-ACP dehydratase